RWRSFVRLEVDRADEWVLASDLAQLLHAPYAWIGLAGWPSKVRPARLLDGHGTLLGVVSTHRPMVAVWVDGPSTLAGPLQRGFHEPADAAGRGCPAVVWDRRARRST